MGSLVFLLGQQQRMYISQPYDHLTTAQVSLVLLRHFFTGVKFIVQIHYWRGGAGRSFQIFLYRNLGIGSPLSSLLTNHTLCMCVHACMVHDCMRTRMEESTQVRIKSVTLIC